MHMYQHKSFFQCHEADPAMSYAADETSHVISDHATLTHRHK
jgi:hypothetical protein